MRPRMWSDDVSATRRSAPVFWTWASRIARAVGVATAAGAAAAAGAAGALGRSLSFALDAQPSGRTRRSPASARRLWFCMLEEGCGELGSARLCDPGERFQQHGIA